MVLILVPVGAWTRPRAMARAMSRVRGSAKFMGVKAAPVVTMEGVRSRGLATVEARVEAVKVTLAGTGTGTGTWAGPDARTVRRTDTRLGLVVGRTETRLGLVEVDATNALVVRKQPNP